MQEESKSIDRACNVTEREQLEMLSGEAELRQKLEAAAHLAEKIKTDKTLLSEEVTGCEWRFCGPLNCNLQSTP